MVITLSYVQSKQDIIRTLSDKIEMACIEDTNFDVFLALDNIQYQDYAYFRHSDRSILQVPIICDIYHYNFNAGENVLMKVTEIDQNSNIRGLFFDKGVMIHRSRYPSRELVLNFWYNLASSFLKLFAKFNCVHILSI